MKFKRSIILCLMVLAVALVCGGCASDFYKGYDKRGYNIGVRYYANGGNFAGTSDRNVVDLFPTSVVQDGGVRLLEPGDKRRGEDGSIRSTISRPEYFLAGWYRERSLRVDENGNPLDENGVLTSVSGKEQGYSYSGRWDFENDKLTIEQGKTYKASEVVLTLYAAWVPYFSFDFYSKNGDTFQKVASYGFDPLAQSNELTIPTWNQETGAMDYGVDFPKIENKTFEAVYADESMQNKLEGKLVHDGEIDYEHGVAVTAKKYYGTWQDGEWYHISTPAQLIDNVNMDGCYIIEKDLNFTGLNWPEGFARGAFSGKMLSSDGTTRKLSAITVRQTDGNEQQFGGLFGRILDGAEFDNISFTGVTYSLEKGSRLQGTGFGLFAGNLSDKAKLVDVHVDGVLKVGDVYALKKAGSQNSYYDGYAVGLLCGNDFTGSGIDYDITCESMAVQIGTADPTYPCKVEVVDGKVQISQNTDPTTNPNS